MLVKSNSSVCLAMSLGVTQVYEAFNYHHNQVSVPNTESCTLGQAPKYCLENYLLTENS